MDLPGKSVHSLVCETSSKNVKEEEAEMDKDTVSNGDQLIRILSPVKSTVVVCSTMTIEKPEEEEEGSGEAGEEEEEEECTTPKGEQFRIPPPLKCPPAPKPNRRRSSFTGDGNN